MNVKGIGPVLLFYLNSNVNALGSHINPELHRKGKAKGTQMTMTMQIHHNILHSQSAMLMKQKLFSKFKPQKW